MRDWSPWDFVVSESGALTVQKPEQRRPWSSNLYNAQERSAILVSQESPGVIFAVVWADLNPGWCCPKRDDFWGHTVLCVGIWRSPEGNHWYVKDTSRKTVLEFFSDNGETGGCYTGAQLRTSPAEERGVRYCHWGGEAGEEWCGEWRDRKREGDSELDKSGVRATMFLYVTGGGEKNKE